MNIQQSLDLSSRHTFGLPSHATRFIQIEAEHEVLQLNQLTQNPIIIGAGSNMLFDAHVSRDLVQYAVTGITLLKEASTHVDLQVNAGTQWNHLVWYTLEQGWQGLENLVEIPGHVGAAPIQNIGAFGVELADVLLSVRAFDLHTDTWCDFSRAECEFGYRDSLFKRQLDRYLIVSLTLRLNKIGYYQCKTNYANIAEQLALNGMELHNPHQIAQVIRDIRWAKLPRPEVYGNAGSFFKNPLVSLEHLQQLQSIYPNMISYPFDGQAKLAAGWLIDQCGLKNYQIGDAWVYPKQALVMCNKGQATYQDVMALKQHIIHTVYAKFQVELEPEVRLIESL